jgi:uncharacterized membrane protein YesL
MKAFTVMGRTIKAAYEELFLCVFLSLIWWAGTLLVVTAAPATLGLQHVTNRIANYKRVDNGFFWDAARSNIGRGWLLYLLHILIPGAVFFNVYFYLSSPAIWMRIIAIAWLWIMLLIAMMMQYLYPLFWQQDEPNFKLILRNALLLALRYPLYTLLMLLFQIVLLALSIVLTLPVLLLTPALLGLAANFALVGVLQEMGLAPQPPVISNT